jgi:hypothetical protein
LIDLRRLIAQRLLRKSHKSTVTMVMGGTFTNIPGSTPLIQINQHFPGHPGAETKDRGSAVTRCR